MKSRPISALVEHIEEERELLKRAVLAIVRDRYSYDVGYPAIVLKDSDGYFWLNLDMNANTVKVHDGVNPVPDENDRP